MLLFEIYDYEGKIIDTGVDKQTAAKILGVKPQDLFKETVVKGRKKKFKIGIAHITFSQHPSVGMFDSGKH